MKLKPILLFVVAGLCQQRSAAIVIWDGGGDGTTLASAANWAGDVLPNPATPDTATWNGTPAGALSLTYASGLGGAAGNPGLTLNLTSGQTDPVSIDSSTNTSIRINAVTLDTGSGAFTLGNGTGSGATAFAVTLGGAGGSTQVWTNNSSNGATIKSDLLFGLGGGGDHALQFAGSGNWAVQAALQPSNTAQLALVKTGAGELALSGGGSLNNTALSLYSATACGVLKEGVTRITAGTYACNTKEFVVGGLDTGTGTNTQLIMEGGSITGVSWLSLGKGNGTGAVSSDILLSNAAAISTTNISMGWMQTNAQGPKATATLAGTSSITATGTVHIAESNLASATVTLNDSAAINLTGTPTTDNQRNIGFGGTATININGTATFADASTRFLNLGYDNGTGVINMTGGTFNKSAGELRVGTTSTSGAYTGTGTFHMTGGTANVGALTLGRGNNNQALVNGTVQVSGGTFNAGITGDITLGFAGAANTGHLIVDGGTFNAGTTVKRWLMAQMWDTSNGVIDVSAGKLNLNTNTDIRFSRGNTGSAGVNTINLTGGEITAYSGNATGAGSTSVVDLGYSGAATANNTLNLDGGALTIGQVVTTSDTPKATLNLNGGTLKATISSANFVNLGGANQKVYVKGGGAIVDSNGSNVTIVDGLLTDGVGAGGLTKLGAGALTLGGAGTYTGATTVNAGSLVLGANGSVNGSSGIAVNNGSKLVYLGNSDATAPVTVVSGTLDGASASTMSTVTVDDLASNTVAIGNGGNGTFWIGSLTFNGAATVNAMANATGMDQAISADTLATPGSGVISINISNSSGFWTSGTDYPVISFNTYGSTTASRFAIGTLTGLNPNQTAEVVNTGSAIAIRITGESLVWTGSTSANWTTAAIGGTKNWSYQGTGIEFSTNSPVIFNDTATTFGVNLAEDVSPSAVVFENSSNNYTLSSTGGFGLAAGSIVLNGTGKVTIGTTNTSTGTVTINSGTLEVPGSVAASSHITNNGLLVLNPAANQTYANPISGTGGVEKSGTAALTLAGANTFTGDLTLTSGQLNLNSAGALGAAPGAFILNGGTLDNTSGALVALTGNKPQTWNADVLFTGSNSLNMGNGAVMLPDSRTVNVVANTLYTGGVADGAAGYALTKTGAGTLVLNGGNIRGNLDVQSGIVGINQDFQGAAPVGTGILQNDGAVGTKWTFWYGPSDVTSNLLIRDNDGTNTKRLGIVKRGSGTLTLANTANSATANLSVDSGKLVVNGGTYGAQFDDGTTNTGLTAVVGNVNGSNGVLEISGSTVNYNNRSVAGTESYRSTLDIGSAAGSAGALRLNSGSVTTNRQIAIGRNTAFGGLVQLAGTITNGGFLALGLNSATGILDVAGGGFNQNGPVTNGAGAGSSGVINLHGTAVYTQTGTGDVGLWVGESGHGVLNVSGSATLAIAPDNNGVQLGRLAAGTGEMNLLGGTVTAKAVTKGAGAGTLNFNGGKLAANVANTAFLTGLTHAYVRPGGGTIDNGGFAVTVGQALEAPSGNGISLAGMTPGGGGYISPPLVTIGGDGTGASAVATIDAAGNLTGITMTNPGNDYTNVTVTLSGGGYGNTGALDGSAAFVPNASGGMTFSGAGTTTLTAINTYTGNTTVNSGTLVLADNAALKFAPGANGVSNKVTGPGTAYLYGDFNIDLSGAAIANGNSWTLVDTTVHSFDPLLFTVTGFTETSSGVHQLVDGSNTWTFTESTGQLTLAVATPSGYAAWASLMGLTSGTNDAPSQDADNDGISNLLEFVLNGNPLASDNSSVAPAVTTSGSNLVLTFKRRDDSEAEVSVVVQTSTTLTAGSWSTYATIGATSGANYTITENGTDADTVSLTIPISGPRAFYRVEAYKP